MRSGWLCAWTIMWISTPMVQGAMANAARAFMRQKSDTVRAASHDPRHRSGAQRRKPPVFLLWDKAGFRRCQHGASRLYSAIYPRNIERRHGNKAPTRPIRRHAALEGFSLFFIELNAHVRKAATTEKCRSLRRAGRSHGPVQHRAVRVRIPWTPTRRLFCVVAEPARPPLLPWPRAR